MTDTIQVPRVWLERLLKINEEVDMHGCSTAYLLGYISSAETLLTNGEKGKE